MSSRGKVSLFTIGYTSSDLLSLKKSLPIKLQYIQVDDTSNPTFPDSYVTFSSQKYWFPFSNVTPSDDEYIKYTDGDEFLFNDSDYSRPENIVFANPDKTKYPNFAVGQRIIYANDVYECVDYVFNWADTGFDYEDNPYSVELINKWRKISDTSDDWIQYWYHPGRGIFFPLEDNELLQSLSSGNASIVSKWESFTGDSSNINLTSMTISQIEEITSLGNSRLSAQSIVNASDSRVTRILSGAVESQSTRSTGATYGFEDGFSTTPTSVIVSKSSGGSEGEGGTYSYSLDQPQIVQYYRTPDGSTAPRPARFNFDYRPNNVSYSNIGSEWTEIPRVNNTPFIDFKSFKLMKITFEFLVGDNNNIFTSCDDKLRELRMIAMRPEPVIFLGFDAMFTEQLTYPTWSGGSGIVFAIVDMSITSVQRARAGSGPDPNSSSQTPTGEINRATVSMTIQELPLETPTLTVLPKLSPVKLTPKPGGSSDKTEFCRNLFLQNEGAVGYVRAQNLAKGGCDFRGKPAR